VTLEKNAPAECFQCMWRACNQGESVLWKAWRAFQKLKMLTQADICLSFIHSFIHSSGHFHFSKEPCLLFKKKLVSHEKMAATDLIDLFLYFLVKHKKRPNLKSCWQSTH